MRNAIVAAGVVAAGIAVNFGGNGAPGRAGPPPSVKSDSSSLRRAAADTPGDHPLAVLDQYWFPNERPASGGATAATAKAGTIDLKFIDSGTKTVEAKLKVSVKADEEEGDWPSARKRLEHSVDEALIVTIPDPLRTHLSIAFDRQLEAIMLAAQDSGYAFDRFWLPWRIETAAESADPEIRKRTRPKRKGGSSYPGFCCFERTPKTSSKVRLWSFSWWARHPPRASTEYSSARRPYSWTTSFGRRLDCVSSDPPTPVPSPRWMRPSPKWTKSPAKCGFSAAQPRRLSPCGSSPPSTRGSPPRLKMTVMPSRGSAIGFPPE